MNTETKLDSITTQYRKFNDNQALTDGQLNEFIDYFESQDRLTLTRGIGVGVICGFASELYKELAPAKKQSSVLLAKETQSDVALQVQLQRPLQDLETIEFDTIVVSQGAGITTDGDIITLREKTLPKTQAIIDIKKKSYKYFKAYTDDVNYPHFFKDGDQMDLWELFTEEEKGDRTDLEDVSKITNLNDKILILYIRSYSNADTPCEDSDCDNNGAEQVSDLRMLIADAAQVKSHMIEGDARDSIYQVHNNYDTIYNDLPNVEVQRVILNTNIKTPAGLKAEFVKAFQGGNTIVNLGKGFTDIAGAFGMAPGYDVATTLYDRINTFPAPTPDDYQYRYDFLKDLVDTYNEMKGLILQLKSECCPSVTSFQKHLMLGPLNASLALGEYTPYRHGFYNSPINTGDDENYQRIVLLISRFLETVNSFSDKYNGQIKVVPSNLNVNLGKTAMSHYYTPSANMVKKWDFDKTLAQTEKYNLGYHTTYLATDDFVRQPLLYNIDGNDFFDIAGHLGKPYKIVLQTLNDIIKEFALPISVFAVVLNKEVKTLPTRKETLVSGELAQAQSVQSVQKLQTPISVKTIRDQLSSISTAITKDTVNTQNTLQTLTLLDDQIRMLNALDNESLIKENPRETKDVVSELLSEFVARITGFEHMGGVWKGGSFGLIYESESKPNVLADFSLPFLCCSKKDPVFLVLPASKLCQHDAAIPMTIIPLDGEIKAYVGATRINAITQVGGQNFFNPALVGTAYLGQSISFTVNDDEVETAMVVHAQPNLTVTTGEATYSEDPDVPSATVEFQIQGSLTGITGYSWNFGDGSPVVTTQPTNNKVSHLYTLVAGEEETFNPTLTVTNANGCSQVCTIAPLKLIGQSTAQCLADLEIIVQYHQTAGPCPGGHTCNSATFNLTGNGVVIGPVYLNNAGSSADSNNHPPGETTGSNRYNSLTIDTVKAQAIADAAAAPDGFISFSLICATASCHTGVAWTTLKLNGAVIYNGCPINNFLTINPCTGEVRK